MNQQDLTAYGLALLSAAAFMQERLSEDDVDLLYALPEAAARGHLFVDLDPRTGECLACAIMGPAEWRDVSLTQGALGPGRLGSGQALACVWFASQNETVRRFRRFILRAAQDWPATTHLVAVRRGRQTGPRIKPLRRAANGPGMNPWFRGSGGPAIVDPGAACDVLETVERDKAGLHG